MTGSVGMEEVFVLLSAKSYVVFHHHHHHVRLFTVVKMQLVHVKRLK